MEVWNEFFYRGVARALRIKTLRLSIFAVIILFFGKTANGITINEKNRLLPRAVKENWILYFEHDPYRHASTVELGEKGFRIKDDICLSA